MEHEFICEGYSFSVCQQCKYYSVCKTKEFSKCTKYEPNDLQESLKKSKNHWFFKKDKL